jgi:hypothetical protein
MQALALALIQDSTSSQLTPQQTQQFVSAFAGIYFVLILLVFVVKVALYAIPMWRICKRAGISPQLSLLCTIPIIGRLITTYVMAFADWNVVPAPHAAPLPPPYTPPSYPPAPPNYPPSQPPTA